METHSQVFLVYPLSMKCFEGVNIKIVRPTDKVNNFFCEAGHNIKQIKVFKTIDLGHYRSD